MRDFYENRGMVRAAAQTLWEGGLMQQPFTVTLNVETAVMMVTELPTGSTVVVSPALPRDCCMEHEIEDEEKISQSFWHSCRLAGFYPP